MLKSGNFAAQAQAAEAVVRAVQAEAQVEQLTQERDSLHATWKATERELVEAKEQAGQRIKELESTAYFQQFAKRILAAEQRVRELEAARDGTWAKLVSLVTDRRIAELESLLRELRELAESFRGRGIYGEGEALLDRVDSALGGEQE